MYGHIHVVKYLIDNNANIASQKKLEHKFDSRWTGLQYQSIISCFPQLWKG